MSDIKYTICRADSATDLAEFVNSHIHLGWLPSGGLMVIEIRTGFAYLQAMVRE